MTNFAEDLNNLMDIKLSNFYGNIIKTVGK